MAEYESQKESVLSKDDKKGVLLLLAPEQLKIIEDAKNQARYKHLAMTAFIVEMAMKGIEEDNRK